MLFVVKENDVETCVLLSKLSNMPPTKRRGRYIYEEKVKAIEDALRHFQML